ncbi:cupin domain-containing protein [uncultured Pseudomonas sp.]|uniref:cupin domain-containing protein n=1 Tax=uncultured Pseudomonas sp. TaxID=114707 RepID=UPI0025D3091D|nr:cupin domain-containing protein [uncultured Pseudomonas sp.]
MLINADFTRRAIVASQQCQWVASPQDGVERVMLDRVGAEKARATSLVRYAPDSCFPRHLHPGGEEMLVLSGTFTDGSGDYPAGWYLRNPPGSSHQPSSAEGTVIFVKLQQMQGREQRYVRIDTHDPAAWRREGQREVCTLFCDETEQVSLQRRAPHAAIFEMPPDGAELLVLTGHVTLEGQIYERGSWLRLPAGESANLHAGDRGATVYLKTGHLADIATGE